jgi:predicted nuclease with TOPRIM domain
MEDEEKNGIPKEDKQSEELNLSFFEKIKRAFSIKDEIRAYEKKLNNIATEMVSLVHENNELKAEIHDIKQEVKRLNAIIMQSK